MYNLTETYDQKFFKDNLEDSSPVAKYLSPIIVKKLIIKTVLDYGCATGHWLGEFLKNGTTAFGIEGSKSILNNLVVDKSFIYELDLRFEINKKEIQLPDEIDLAFSFEVAEHIEEKYSDVFLDNLTLFKPKFIMLTAAPPGQGGLGHVNEQPKEYWYSKLEKRNYIRDTENEKLFFFEIENARRFETASKELRRPDQFEVCKRHVETIGCEKGVWVPPWLPKNLMILKKSNKT